MAHQHTWRMEHYSTLLSTNDYCIEQARSNHKQNLAVLADSQSSPRGSRGRQWVEPDGNLAFSLLYWPEFSVSKINWIPFVASLALYDALAELCGDGNALAIKWPNDLLFKQKKIAGILIESNVELPDRLDWLVIGFGVNLLSVPKINREIGCLQDFMEEPPSTTILSQAITRYFDYWVLVLTDNQEATIRNEWLKRGLPLHSALSISVGKQRWEGLYCGIDEHGLLLLQTDQGLKHLSTGDVFWLYKEQE